MYIVTRRWGPEEAGQGYGGQGYGGMNRGGGGQRYNAGGPPRPESNGAYRYEVSARWEQPREQEKHDWTKPTSRNERLEQ